jgi:hypothetical protein
MMGQREQAGPAWNTAAWPRGVGPSRKTKARNGATTWIGMRSVTPCALATARRPRRPWPSRSCRSLARLAGPLVGSSRLLRRNLRRRLLVQYAIVAFIE